MNLWVGIPVTFLLVYRAWSRRSLTPLGIVAAVATAAVHIWHPWSVFFACLVVFFLGGTAVTKVKHDVKARLTLSASGSSGGEGPRTAVQVLANSIVASILIWLHKRQLDQRALVRGDADASCWLWGTDPLVVGIIANYAAVAADTFASELGILSKTRPRLITSLQLREVPPGTNGGVTVAGTLAGLVGALMIAVTSVLLLPFCQSSGSASNVLGGVADDLRVGIKEKLVWVTWVTIWGALGSLLDSFLGAWLQASVVDTRTGKIVEGDGGRTVSRDLIDRVTHVNLAQTVLTAFSEIKVLVERPAGSISDPLHPSNRSYGRSVSISSASHPGGHPSRRLESGLGVLDNNAVNLLMALVMSVGGVLVAAWYWNVSLQGIVQA
ncbi:MAG: hypothetical protein M1826_002272 [Phylliscum demangeonii]|nr:MAG: hypothetical protein M1826_002272 [Phylliscum demangeonii]